LKQHKAPDQKKNKNVALTDIKGFAYQETLTAQKAFCQKTSSRFVDTRL